MPATPDRLRRLSELLDEALDLTEPQRTQWLDALPDDVATAHGATLRALLARHAAAETGDLIDRLPVFTVVGGDDGAPPTFGAGDTVGPYRLLREIGRGGMGEVWLAERSDGQLKRQVALKLPMLAARRSVLVQRFARERDILGTLAHPHIARLYDAGLADDGQPYLALEFVHGEPITAYCAAHALDARAQVQLLRQVMQAVQYAHAHLVIHRDLKPSNVLVTADGHAMLLDFGIAKLLDDERSDASATEVTQFGERVLTLDYAAPEQIAGAAVSIATDVHALGVLLYELLTGQRPFAGSRHAVEEAIVASEPKPPSRSSAGSITALARGRAGELDTIVQRALKKRPGERYATVDAFSDDLARWLDGAAIAARGDSRWYRLRKLVARNRLVFGAAGAIGVALVAGLSVALWQARVAREQALIARTEAQTAAAVQNFLEGILRANTGSQADPMRARQKTALELLEDGAARIEAELDSAPAAKVRVLKTLADMYRDLGEYDRVAQLLEQRLAVAERLEPDAGAAVVQALAELGNQMSRMDRAPDALKLFTRADAVAQQAAGIDADTRIALDLGWADYHSRRADARGIAPARRAAELLERRPPSEELVRALLLKGDLERTNGLAADAVRSLRAALAAADRLPGGGGAARVSPLMQLALAEAANGDHTAAEAAMREGLQVAERTVGVASTWSINMLGNLGQLLERSGRYRETIDLMRDARERLDRLPDSPDKAQMMKSILFVEAPAVRRYGDPERALALSDEWNALQRLLPMDPANVEAMLGWRAEVLTDLGELAQARSAVDAALRLREQHELRNYRGLAVVAQADIALALAEGNAARARDVLQRWTDHPQAAKQRLPELLAATAEVKLAAESAAAASDAASAALDELARPSFGDRTKAARFRLLLVRARALLALGRADDARRAAALALDANAAMCDVERSPDRLLALVALADAHLALGDRAAARAAAERADAIARRYAKLGPQYLEPMQSLQSRLSSVKQ